MGGFKIRIFLRIWNRVQSRVFQGDNRSFKVLVPMLEMLDTEHHGIDPKKKGKKLWETFSVDYGLEIS